MLFHDSLFSLDILKVGYKLFLRKNKNADAQPFTCLNSDSLIQRKKGK